MNYQIFADSVDMPCCILSVEIKGSPAGDEIRDIRIAAANRAYKDTMGSGYYDGMPYYELVPQDDKFEDICYRAAILKKRMHAYVETKAFNTWTDQTLIPLGSEDGHTGYCQFIFEFTEKADPDRMSEVSLNTVRSLLRANLALFEEDDIHVSTEKVAEIVIEETGAKAVQVLLIDRENRTVINFCRKLARDVRPSQKAWEDILPYDLVMTWEDLIGVSNDIIIRDDRDMCRIEQKNPRWAASMRSNNIENLVLVPLRRSNTIIGYMYVSNFDVSGITEIKELIEIISFVLGIRIYNHLLLKELEKASLVDSLTGLLNRRAMNDRMKSIEGSPGTAYGIINIDLNGLKTVNDRDGHDAGDRLLIRAAEILKKVFHYEDLFRTGGDEFIVIAAGIREEVFKRKLMRLHKDMEKNAEVSFAAGSFWSDGSSDIKDVFHRADEAMYSDKLEYYKRHPELARLESANSIPQGLPGGFFIYDALNDEKILFADRNVIALFGCGSFKEFIDFTGGTFKGMVYEKDLHKIESDILAQTFNSGKRHDYVRYRIVTKQGDIRYVEDFGHLLYDSQKSCYYYVFIVDVEQYEYDNHDRNSFAETEIFRTNKKIDQLTGLLNMDAFLEKSKGILLNRAAESEYPTSIVIFDILGLREINRTEGREYGDRKILRLSEKARRFMPDYSFMFRGHEAEIIVVCRNRNEQALTDSISKVIAECASPVIFGVSSTNRLPMQASDGDGNILMQALADAQHDLELKKMLDTKSVRSHSLTSLVRALEEVDSDTEKHVQRTQAMGTELGLRIGLSDFRLSMLRLLCLLHDIGKIAVPLEILNKPGKLTGEEWATLRSHARKGYEIAMSSEDLRPLAEGILYHHERWDGKGYPEGLCKEETPVLSRIISIVDAYDAMVNDRAYRKAMSSEEAMEEIRANAGTQFDPYLANEFLKLLEEKPQLAAGVHVGASEVRDFDRTVMKNSGTGITTPVSYSKYVLDLDDRIIEVDENFEAITGYSRQETVGKMKQWDLIPEEEMPFYLEQVQSQFRKGDIAYLRHPVKKKDGSVIQVICNGERYFDSAVRAFRSTILIFEV